MVKRKGEWSQEKVKETVKKYRDLRNLFIKDVENIHVKLLPGNSKTGSNCRTVSLLPIVDCPNCSKCKLNCYDVRHDCINKNCLVLRAQNSAIHKKDRARYWMEIDEGVKADFVLELRLNVGGDLEREDFDYVQQLGEDNKRTEILFFTKNYNACNDFIAANIDKYPDNFGFPANVHPIYSAWIGMKMDNPFNVPTSHVLWENGDTTAPEFGSYYCGGNCSACHFHAEGCWELKSGESVIFKAH